MKKINNVLLINMAVLLVYLVIINVSISRTDPYACIGVMVTTMIVVFAHAGINLIVSIISFVRREKNRGLHFLLATGMVLVAGCAGCFVGASI